MGKFRLTDRKVKNSIRMVYDKNKLLTKQQIAEALGKHPNTIDQWRKKHQFPKPALAPTKRTMLWRWKDICDFYGFEE
jgi:predicted DNA-binding transcriptional regulator AlpA